MTTLSTALRACGAGVLLAFAASAAFAKDPAAPGKFYIGVDAGTARAKARMSPAYFEDSERIQNDDSTAFRIRAGFQFMRYIALEGGYVDLGDFDLENVPYICPPAAPPPCTYDVRSNTKGYFLNAVGTWPIGEKVLLNGRAGAVRVKNVKNERAPDLFPTEGHASLNSTGALLGIGVAYRMSPHIDAEVSWTYFNGYSNDSGIFTDAPRLDLKSSQFYAIGMRYRF